MPQIIGRVVTGTYETVRGPDVVHRIAVDRAWLLRGELVEFELPRNVTCAACDGGGCDRCARSGAITLRARGETSEPIQLTLPKRTESELLEQPTLVVRVPGHGGERPGASDARGLLLLKVVASAESGPGVRLVHAPPPRLSLRARPKDPSLAPAPERTPGRVIGVVAVMVVMGWIALILFSSVGIR